MNFIIHGAAGRMGGNLIASVEKNGHTVAACVDILYADAAKKHPDYPCFASISDCDVPADCIIDFSNHVTTIPLLGYAVSHKIPVMLATTGQTEEEKAAITAAAEQIPLFRAANMSLGIATLVSLVKTAVCMFPDADIEIIEKHHNQKLDVPSGTALALADAVKAVREEADFVIGRHENGKRRKEEVGIHSLRLGGVVGEHEVIITTGNETISLKHEAHSRAVFADGGVMAAAYVAGQTAPGLYTMEDLVAACR
ncbi:MAG: 4-hydroxy-tetrahydrodipicolinate reductase [Ruminococcaceae bacterium]|nr:4-hydroxy-tetrahydrodipicolinate reductase [Oscillospiraceae bacterium]